MLTILSQAFKRTAKNWKAVLTIFLVNVLMSLILVRPFYVTLKAESNNSIEFDKLLSGFDFTVFFDFMNKNGHALKPFWPLGAVLAFIYLILNIFFSGGILNQLSLREPFRLGDFLKSSAHYFGRFSLLFLIEFVVIIVLLIISIIFLGLFGMMADGGTEITYVLWLTPPFLIMVFLMSLVLNIANYAKVLLYKYEELGIWNGFLKATGYVFSNFKTMRIFWAVVLLAILLLLLYLLIESIIGMTSAVTIVIMFIIQQGFIFARVFLKTWLLSNAFEYLCLKPIPIPLKAQKTGDCPPADEVNDSENKLSE